MIEDIECIDAKGQIVLMAISGAGSAHCHHSAAAWAHHRHAAARTAAAASRIAAATAASLARTTTATGITRCAPTLILRFRIALLSLSVLLTATSCHAGKVVRRRPKAEGLREADIHAHKTRPIPEIARNDQIARERVGIKHPERRHDRQGIAGFREGWSV